MGAVANGLNEPGRRDQMRNWVHNNAFAITTCLHPTASPKPPAAGGVAEVLEENYSSPTGTMKARLFWSGFLGSDHYSDILVTTQYQATPPLVTVSVVAEDSNFSPDGSCHYLQGDPL